MHPDSTRIILIALGVAILVVTLLPLLLMGGMITMMGGAMMGGGMMGGGQCCSGAMPWLGAALVLGLVAISAALIAIGVRTRT